MKVVLDANAAVKWFLVEEGSDDMRTVRALIARGSVEALAPDFLLELANALRYARELPGSSRGLGSLGVREGSNDL